MVQNSTNMILNLVAITLRDEVVPVTILASSDAISNEVDHQLHRYCVRISREHDAAFWEEYPQLEPYSEAYLPVWNTITSPELTSLTIDVDMAKRDRLSLAVMRQRIISHFRSLSIITAKGFTDDPEIWIPSQEIINNGRCYDKFVLSPDYAYQSNGWELHVSFVGTSRVSNQSLYKFQTLPQEGFTVVAGDEVIGVNRLMQHHLLHPESIFPVASPLISSRISIPTAHTRIKDKYVQRKKKLDSFLQNYLLTTAFTESLGLSYIANDWFSFPDDYCYQVDSVSRNLLFGSGQTGISPFSGLNQFGPYYVPTSRIRFLFVYFRVTKDDQLIARNKLEEALRNGINGRNSLMSLTRVPFQMDEAHDICLTNTAQPAADLRQKLADLTLDKDTTYLAFYISPFKEGEYEGKYDYFYAQIKEALLERNIQSQVINYKNPSSNAFTYHLPNIAIATLAKVGGVPFTLANPTGSNDLIIGVGAHLSKKKGIRFVGSAFCYDNKGSLRDFDCFPDNDPQRITSNISAAIDHFLETYGTPNRLIIHYYKTMSRREARPITEKLYNLHLSIPVYVITINKTETEGLVGFDLSKSDFMPVSGTYLDMGGSFLLYNNERYKDTTDRSNNLYPIKLRIQKVGQNGNNLNISMDEINNLITQVYQFSRLSWKTIAPQNMPITTLYPDLAAEIVPFFTNTAMPRAGRQTPWFL